jgi:hypothetical protein
MRQLLAFAAGFTVGYVIFNKLAPIVQAKIEAVDLDRMWEIWNEVGE